MYCSTRVILPGRRSLKEGVHYVPFWNATTMDDIYDVIKQVGSDFLCIRIPPADLPDR